jgi:hypothetical protein
MKTEYITKNKNIVLNSLIRSLQLHTTIVTDQ